MTAGVEAVCRACDARTLETFYRVESIPSQTTVLLDTAQEAADYPTGTVELAFCATCGFIQNVAFDPDAVDYSQPTEESQAFSPEFQRFAEKLASDLVARHDLRGGQVVEVGCGKGDFLQLLAELGINEGVGIDPGYLPNREVDGATLRFIKDWYGPQHRSLTGDLVLSRHLLEHVPNVAEFTAWLVESATLTPGAGLFTEVPDARRVLLEGAFWDVYYEHCSYFTLGSLGRMLRRVGLRVDRLETVFSDQYLIADGRPGDERKPHPAEEPVDEVGAEVETFGEQATRLVAEWRTRIDEALVDGNQVAIWGGGSKAVAFLAAVHLDDRPITVVDINPHKQGKYLPGTAIEVEPPGVLMERRPQLVIPMNPIYETEIRRDLGAMGLDPTVMSL